MQPRRILFLSLCSVVMLQAEPPHVKIVREGEKYSLSRNGRPCLAKGAVGAVHLEDLVAAGGNSIRAGVDALDRAQQLGLSVLTDLPFGKQRWGFNYGDPAVVRQQRQQLRARGLNPPAIRAIRVYRPPFAGGDQAK